MGKCIFKTEYESALHDAMNHEVHRIRTRQPKIWKI